MDTQTRIDNKIKELVKEHADEDSIFLTKKNHKEEIGKLTRNLTEGIEDIYLEECYSLPNISHIVDTQYMGYICIMYRISHEAEMRKYLEFDIRIPIYDLDLFQYLGWVNAGII